MEVSTAVNEFSQLAVNAVGGEGGSGQFPGGNRLPGGTNAHQEEEMMDKESGGVTTRGHNRPMARSRWRTVQRHWRTRFWDEGLQPLPQPPSPTAVFSVHKLVSSSVQRYF